MIGYIMLVSAPLDKTSYQLDYNCTEIDVAICEEPQRRKGYGRDNIPTVCVRS